MITCVNISMKHPALDLCVLICKTWAEMKNTFFCDFPHSCPSFNRLSNEPKSRVTAMHANYLSKDLAHPKAVQCDTQCTACALPFMSVLRLRQKWMEYASVVQLIYMICSLISLLGEKIHAQNDYAALSVNLIK